MTENETDSLQELQQFLEELESLAPARDETAGSRVIYRLVGADEAVDDSLPGEEEREEAEEEPERLPDQPEIEEVRDFLTSQTGPIAAVDSGIVRLGETENGLVIALRSAIVIDDQNESRVRLFRTGPIYLDNNHKAEVLHQIGTHLGRPNLFVELDESDPANPRPTAVKRGVADDSHQFGDRFRNWLERLVQRIAVTCVENGIVLFDGALTLRTRDTPNFYLEELAHTASGAGNAVIAISKQSILQIQGKSIRFWLNDVPNRACYRPLSPAMRRDRVERVLGNVYAVRFSPLGPTLRMDIKAVDGQTDDEAGGQFYSSALMRGGYPDILVRAHAHSYFTPADVVSLQAQAGAKYAFRPQPEVDLRGIFAPFGGRFK